MQSRCHTFLGHFSWLTCFGAVFKGRKKRSIEQTTLQTGNIAACLGSLDRTEAAVDVSLPALQFGAPTQNRARSPRSWQGEGGPWVKGRAGIMVNHRVKHAAWGWGQAARHHRERKGLSAQRHCFISNGSLPQQWEPMHISTRRGWLTRLHPQPHRDTVCVTAVVSQFSQQFICSVSLPWLTYE